MENNITETVKVKITEEIKKSVLLKLLKEGMITEREYYTLNKIG